MEWRRILVAAGVVLASTSAAANEAKIDDFYGEWRGVEVRTSGKTDELVPTAGDLDVRLRPEDAGFQVSWTGFEREADGGLARHKVEASFTPTERPGVFDLRAGQSSLLSRLFADPASVNPLKGEPLIWARLAGPTLIVYRLAIKAGGGFDLDRYERTLTDEGMTARYSRRIENDLLLTIDGRLERAGG